MRSYPAIGCSAFRSRRGMVRAAEPHTTRGMGRPGGGRGCHRRAGEDNALEKGARVLPTCRRGGNTLAGPAGSVAPGSHWPGPPTRTVTVANAHQVDTGGRLIQRTQQSSMHGGRMPRSPPAQFPLSHSPTSILLSKYILYSHRKEPDNLRPRSLCAWCLSLLPPR